MCLRVINIIFIMDRSGNIPSIHSLPRNAGESIHGRRIESIQSVHSLNAGSTVESVGVSPIRMAAGVALASLALFTLAKSGSGEQDSFYNASEASGEVLTTVPEIIATPAGLPESSQSQFDAHWPAIERMMPVYEAVEEETGVPSAYMAALHYREGSNSPTSSMYAGEKLGTTNPDHGDVKGTDIFTNGVKAAEHFKRNAKVVYGVEVRADMPDNELAFAFLAYNRGSMYKNAEDYIGREMHPDESPYVMNGIDQWREAMHWPSHGHYGRGTDWGEPESVQGRRNKPLGALTIVHGINLRKYGPVTPEVQAEDLKKIVIIGDSLSVGDDKYGHIQDVDGAIGKEVIHYNALGGRSLTGEDSGVEAINNALPEIERADSVVIALGTNMIESAEDNEIAFDNQLRESIQTIRGVNPNIEILMPELVSFKDGTKMGARRDARNKVMQKLAEEGLINFIPLDLQDSDKAGDDVHLTQEGYKERTAKILSAS